MAKSRSADRTARRAPALIVLNRPRALNALTLTMVRAIARALDEFERDPAVARVVVAGAGGRAFCAGGDIRKLYEQGRAGDHAAQLDVLARGISPRPSASSAIRSLCRADRRHRHGRRRRALDARLASRRERALRIRDARGRHRLFSRCRRDLVAAALAASHRRLSGADGLARRARATRSRSASRRVRSERRLAGLERRWRATGRSTRHCAASPRRRRLRR